MTVIMHRVLDTNGAITARVTLPDTVAVNERTVTLPVWPAVYLHVGVYQLRCTVNAHAHHLRHYPHRLHKMAAS